MPKVYGPEGHGRPEAPSRIIGGMRYRRGLYLPDHFYYGPTHGAQWVRDNAGPRTVADPGGGIAFTSIADLVTKVTANVADSTFVASGTTFAMSGTNTIPANKRPKIYFPGAVGSKIIDGGGGESFLQFNAGGGEIHGGKWIGTVVADAVINNPANKWMRSIVARSNFTLQDAWFVGNNGGLGYDSSAVAPGTLVISHNDFQNGQRYGFSVSGMDWTGTDYGLLAPLIEYNRVRGNRTHASISPDGDSGGWKFLGTDGMICRYNWLDGNFGFAAWWDGANRNLNCYDNVAELNQYAGFFYELGSGGTSIHNNAALNNGEFDTTYNAFTDPNILISASNGLDDVYGGSSPNGIDVSRNLVDGLSSSILLIDHNVHYPFSQCKEVNVNRNQEWLRGGGRTGVTDLHNLNITTLPANNNTFEINNYRVAGYNGTQTKWDWDALQTWAQWQALGHDDIGTVAAI